ncbi:hypothetical protein OIDMADRAFT_57853 [Oidiodendron maius Zn]|uniref:Uncharacterized protein n=1 Tax=Oidiodendron maius (strain Zn) TaxID=913774 RepID=A0A0C3D5P4_OIDMZ|nr:hypothetical protein OIDMADRAFT_57853 [Oidiodendron maius Zn]
MSETAKKRWPLPVYQSKQEKYEARNARQREKYQQKRALEQGGIQQRVSYFSFEAQSQHTILAHIGRKTLNPACKIGSSDFCFK